MAGLLSPMSRHLRRIAGGMGDLLPQDYGPRSPARAQYVSSTLAGLGATRPAREAVLLPPLLLGHSLDHLLGIAASLEADKVIYSAMSLARPALESAAMVFYLLGEDADERERIRRWANVEMNTLVERLRILGPEERAGDLGMQLGSRLYWLSRAARDEGFVVAERGRRIPGWQRERYLEPAIPSDQTLITTLLDDLDDDGRVGRLIHRATSAVTHGRLHGLTMFIVSDEADRSAEREGAVLVPFGVSLSTMANWLTPVLWGVRRAVLRCSAFYAWDTRHWESMVLNALTDCRVWMSAPGR